MQIVSEPMAFIARHRLILSVIAAAASLTLLGLAASGAVDQLSKSWQQEEYSHAPIIPFIAMFLAAQRSPRFAEVAVGSSWMGALLFVLALLIALLGQLGLLYTLSMYAIWLGIVALVVAAFGAPAAKTMWVPLAYLLFAIPLPGLLYNALSQELQLISSEIGVAGIRLFGIAVFQAGNVIDLGTYQLQVVEACSGLRYLFPLTSFGFLLACIYQGSIWAKAVIGLMTIPIAVAMNCVRIIVVGISVEYWGISAAEGFLHDFEGWAVFIACLALLLVGAYGVSKVDRKEDDFLNRLDLDLPPISSISWPTLRGSGLPIVSIVLVALVSAPAIISASSTEAVIPQRPLTFNTFPLLHENWIGRESSLDLASLEKLQLTDYLMANYSKGDARNEQVNLYVAWYEAQHKGAMAHSPRACLPGGGWQIVDIEQRTLDRHSLSKSDSQSLRVNRVLIQKDEQRQLVYYWFSQRGRILTNEYAVKWYLFLDGLLKKRADGSMIRVVAPIPKGVNEAKIDQQLEEFVETFSPVIDRYITH